MKALIVIDYTYDFVALDGKLTCGEPAQMIEDNLMNLIETFIANQDYVVLANDFHEQNDKFHPEIALFPPHNIEGTKGRQFYGKLKTLAQLHPEFYQMSKRRYSAFAGTDLDIRLRERNVKEVHLCGVCTDICVLHTAIDAYRLGYHIVVHEKSVASFNQIGHDYALTHFKTVLGATVTD